MKNPTTRYAISARLRELCSRAGLLPSQPDDRRCVGKLVFGLGVGLYLSAQVSLIVIPIVSRSAPVETDDAYVYILKSAEMESCFLQDCAALNVLRPQLQEPSSDPEITWIRSNEYGRAFLVYHPLYSALLSGLHVAGLPWELAFNVLSVIGAILISLAICWWLYVLWGPGPAGFGLVFFALALGSLPGQGINSIVPSNFALGIAMLVWTAIVRWRDRAAWVVPVGAVALVALHPVGRIYAVGAIAIYILHATRPWRRKTWWCAGLGSLVVGASFVLPLIVSRPEMVSQLGAILEGGEGIQGVVMNLRAAIESVDNWAGFYGGIVVAGLLVLIGILTTPLRRWRHVLVGGGVLAVLTVGSLVYVIPRVPAEVSGRVWVAMAVLLSGAIGQTAWAWLSSIWGLLQRVIREGLANQVNSRLRATGSTLLLTLIISAGCAFGYVALVGTSQGIDRLERYMAVRTIRQDVSLDPSQPALMLSQSHSSDSVLYMDEVPMHFYFTRGALDRGAIFSPAVADTPEQKAWIDDNASIRYVVAWSPIEDVPNTREGAFPLDPCARVEIRNLPGGTSSHPLRLYLTSPGSEANLILRSLDTGPATAQTEPIEIHVPANWSGWLQVAPGSQFPSSGFALEVNDAKHPVLLGGIRGDSDSPLYWPWDQGIAVVYDVPNTEALPRIIRFESANLCPTLSFELRVLADKGSTVLAEVVR
ncbi:hypothetical protein ACFLSZ_01710 [Candidatus Bipolaricaulota bacterium]